jgi:BlaI family penicillinase repressor
VKKPQISDAERQVMEILWQDHPLPSVEIVRRLASRGWSENTIKTLVSRLVKKGFVAFVEEGYRYYYSPLINQAECLREDKEKFLERWSSEAGFSLLAQFVAQTDLTPQQIEELKRILEDKSHEPS